MRDDTRKMLEEYIDVIDGKILKKEDNIRGSFYMSMVGTIGMCSYVLTKDEGGLMAGAIVVMGSLLFKMINSNDLSKMLLDREVIKYCLDHPEVVKDERYNGKHFKR